MQPFRTTFSIVSLAALCAFAGVADGPRFSATEKAHVTKHFTSTSKLAIESLSIRVDGEDQDQEMPKIELTNERELSVTDEYRTVAGGRPTKLARTFDAIESKLTTTIDGTEAEDGVEEAKSKLAKRVVLFTWDADAKKYGAEYSGEKGDDDLLEGLDADLDLLAFLPTKAVAEKDTWTLDGAALGVLLQAGGDLHLESDAKDDEEGGSGWGLVAKTIRDHLKGKVEATYRGERDVDGTKCGVIAFEGDLESDGEYTEDEGKTRVEAKLEVEGELLWDLGAGRFHSVKATSKTKLTLSSTSDVEMDEGETASVEEHVELAGTIELTGKTE